MSAVVSRDVVVGARANLLAHDVRRPVRVRVVGPVGRWRPSVHEWFDVLRVNLRSVTVDCRGGIATVPYEQLLDVV